VSRTSTEDEDDYSYWQDAEDEEPEDEGVDFPEPHSIDDPTYFSIKGDY
jgi:hypothetical protein